MTNYPISEILALIGGTDQVAVTIDGEHYRIESATSNETAIVFVLSDNSTNVLDQCAMYAAENHRRLSCYTNKDKERSVTFWIKGSTYYCQNHSGSPNCPELILQTQLAKDLTDDAAKLLSFARDYDRRGGEVPESPEPSEHTDPVPRAPHNFHTGSCGLIPVRPGFLAEHYDSFADIFGNPLSVICRRRTSQLMIGKLYLRDPDDNDLELIPQSSRVMVELQDDERAPLNTMADPVLIVDITSVFSAPVAHRI